MVKKIRDGTILLKVTVNCEKDALRFCDELQKIYKLMLVGRLIPNIDAEGVHCYINIDLSSEV